jgi:hypothetical protein
MITVGQLNQISGEALTEGQKISQTVGDNWYPCGFAHLHCEGRNEIIKLFKKSGERIDRGGSDGYRLGYFRTFKDSYAGGYWITFDYPAKNATESQSLNFSVPLYHFIQSKLAELGVRVEVESRVD